jgi:galactonate dehydratase
LTGLAEARAALFAPAFLRAAPALDITIWDILGEATGLPIWQILGGRRKDRIRLYSGR